MYFRAYYCFKNMITIYCNLQYMVNINFDNEIYWNISETYLLYYNTCVAECPPGFVIIPGYDQSCYNLLTTRSDWSTHGDNCRRFARGSHAVTVETAEEDMAIINFLNNRYHYGE